MLGVLTTSIHQSVHNGDSERLQQREPLSPKSTSGLPSLREQSSNRESGRSLGEEHRPQLPPIEAAAAAAHSSPSHGRSVIGSGGGGGGGGGGGDDGGGGGGGGGGGSGGSRNSSSSSSSSGSSGGGGGSSVGLSLWGSVRASMKDLVRGTHSSSSSSSSSSSRSSNDRTGHHRSTTAGCSSSLRGGSDRAAARVLDRDSLRGGSGREREGSAEGGAAPSSRVDPWVAAKKAAAEAREVRRKALAKAVKSAAFAVAPRALTAGGVAAGGGGGGGAHAPMPWASPHDETATRTRTAPA